MQTVNVKIVDQQFIDEFGLPTYATPESAGMDIRANITDEWTIYQGDRVLIPTGLSIDLDNPHCMWILVPKSGLGHKKGVILGNLVGIIDSDYHQQVFVSVWFTGPNSYTIKRGDFICQAILVPILRVNWNIVEDFDRSVARTGGFGSNGTR